MTNASRHSGGKLPGDYRQRHQQHEGGIATSKNNFGFDNAATDATSTWRNLLGFWILGLCNNYGYVVMLSAAQDILKRLEDPAPVATDTNARVCNEVGTGAILLADILPCVFIKVVAPFLPLFVHSRIASCVLLSGLGFVSVANSTRENPYLAYLGVVMTSLSSGLGEVTMLSYSHRYTKNVISTWASGTGGAGIIGSGSYLLLRNFFNLKESDTLMLMLFVPVLQAVSFWLLLTHPTPTIAMVTVHGVGSQEQMIEPPKMTLKRKFALVPKLLKYTVPLFFVYFFEYFINQGLYELIQFDNIDIKHETQYHWLQFDYQVGVFISRSSVNLITINKIWLMAIFQCANVFVMLYETMSFFIPSYWIVVGLVLWEGLLGGAAYVNTFYRVSKEVPWEERQAALGIAAMADSFGIALAGWASMPVHNQICKSALPSRAIWPF